MPFKVMDLVVPLASAMTILAVVLGNLYLSAEEDSLLSESLYDRYCEDVQEIDRRFREIQGFYQQAIEAGDEELQSVYVQQAMEFGRLEALIDQLRDKKTRFTTEHIQENLNWLQNLTDTLSKVKKAHWLKPKIVQENLPGGKVRFRVDRFDQEIRQMDVQIIMMRKIAWELEKRAPKEGEPEKDETKKQGCSSQ